MATQLAENSNDNFNLKEVIKQEYIKCFKDPSYFMRKYCYIQHPLRGKILFDLYQFQEKTVNEFADHRFTVVNKSRQMGISTLVSGYALWLMLFHDDKSILAIATKADVAKKLLKKVKLMYEMLPVWIKKAALLNVDTPKGTPRIKLFKATLDSPIDSIANFDTFNPEYKKAFLNNFNNRGYSFQVPRDIKTIPQIAELIKDPAVIKKMTQLVNRFAPRLLALPLAIGAGYAGVTGLSKLVGGTAVSAAEIQRDAQGNVIQPQAIERPQVIEKPETVQYNRETGSFVNPITQEKTDQNALLGWATENPLTALAGSSVALSANEIPRNYKMRRGVGDFGPLPGGKGKIRSSIGIGGALKPVLTTLGTPLMTLGFEGLLGKQRLEEGENMSDILMDPLGPALGLSFMEPLSKASGVVRDAPARGITGMFKNYTDLSNVGKARPGMLGKALRLGMSPRMIAGASRFLGLPGLALTTGLAGYNAYKNYQNEEGMIYDFFNKDE